MQPNGPNFAALVDGGGAAKGDEEGGKKGGKNGKFKRLDKIRPAKGDGGKGENLEKIERWT